jgi:hypothetical protein
VFIGHVQESFIAPPVLLIEDFAIKWFACAGQSLLFPAEQIPRTDLSWRRWFALISSPSAAGSRPTRLWEPVPVTADGLPADMYPAAFLALGFGLVSFSLALVSFFLLREDFAARFPSTARIPAFSPRACHRDVPRFRFPKPVLLLAKTRWSLRRLIFPPSFAARCRFPPPLVFIAAPGAVPKIAFLDSVLLPLKRSSLMFSSVFFLFELNLLRQGLRAHRRSARESSLI